MNTLLLHRSVRAASKAEFSRSGGPGGQNVNKVNTKVTLRIRLDELAGLNEAEIFRLRELLSGRINNEGEIVIASSEERSQHANLERAYSRMEVLVINAARLPRSRRPTKPGKAAREERLRAKRRRSLAKAERCFRPEE